MDVEASSRRRTPRRKLDSQVGLLLRGKFIGARCLQIGEGGILLESELDFEPNTQVILSVMIPLVGFVIGRLEILYAKPSKGLPNYGCRFVDLDFTFKKSIRIYVSKKTEMEDEDSFTVKTA